MGSSVVSVDNTQPLLLHSELNHSDHQLHCTLGDLSPCRSDANGAGPNQTFNAIIQTVLCYFYQLMDCLESAGVIEQLVKGINRGFKAKDYKRTEGNVAKFLKSENPFTKLDKLPLSLPSICELLRSIREEINAKLEAEQERFKKRKVIWKRFYRSVTVILSLFLGLLSCFAGPHAAIVGGSLGMGISGLCDHAYESLSESMEATFKKDKDIVTATCSLGEENGLQIAQNNLKRVVDGVRTISRCSQIRWTDFAVRKKVREIDEALQEMKCNFKGIKSDVKKIITCLEKISKIKPLKKRSMLLGL